MSSSERIRKDNLIELNYHSKHIDILINENNQLKQRLENLNDYIYEECNELRRQVQLNTEETIVRIKFSFKIDPNNEIINLPAELNYSLTEINKFNYQYTNQIKDYENYLNSKTIDTADLMKRTKTRNVFLKFLKSNFKQAILDDKTNQQVLTNLNKLTAKLINLSYKLNNDSMVLEKSLFGQIRLSFVKNTNESNLSEINRYSLGHLLETRLLNLLKFNRISTLRIFKRDFTNSDFDKVLIELLNNDNILIIRGYSLFSYVNLYNLNTQMLIDDKSLKLDYDIQNIKSTKELIAFVCVSLIRSKSTIIIIDFNLNIIATKELGHINLIGSDESYLYCMNNLNKEAKCFLFDWSLNESDKKRISFQRNNSKESFYLFNYAVDRTNSNKSVFLQLEHLHNRLIVNTNAYCAKDKFIVIYNDNGDLINKIRLNSESSRFVTRYKNEEGLLYLMSNSSLINVYNLDGLNLKQIQLLNYELVFDENYIIHLLVNRNHKFCFFNYFNIIT